MYQNKNYPSPNYNKNLHAQHNDISKPIHTSILLTPTHNPINTTRTIRLIMHKDLDEMRAKGLHFWYDDKFALGHKCKKNKLYSL